jgi:transketolase
MRKQFAESLYKHMIKNENIWLITGDLGFGMFDKIKNNIKDRFVNVGAAEQTMMGVAVGMALEGKIPFVYSITPFLLYRPFETIRNYVNHENIPVKMIGSGRNIDYAHDGFSHWAEEDEEVMRIFKNIQSVWPTTKEEIPNLVEEMIKTSVPYYVNLSRN